jgi:hypothetical protein
MPLPPEAFKEKLVTMVRDHYRSSRAPLLLAHLGGEIEKQDAWPEDRNGRNLKQLINDCAGSDLQIVWDKRSPAYIAVVTPDVRNEVEAQIAQRLGGADGVNVRLDEIARPVLLAFCVQIHDEAPVYVRRSRPFRYEIGTVPPELASDFVIVEPEFRRPGLRIDRPSLLPVTDRLDLQARIQKWAIVHGLQVEQFARFDQDERDSPDTSRSALDRLLAAQPPDVILRMVIPADIAQSLARMR